MIRWYCETCRDYFCFGSGDRKYSPEEYTFGHLFNPHHSINIFLRPGFPRGLAGQCFEEHITLPEIEIAIDEGQTLFEIEL